MTDSWEQNRLAHRDSQASGIAASALSLITERGAPALTMSAIAKRAEVSRQTLYRYYSDVDAVMIGIANFVAAHDADFEQMVAQEPDPASQLDLIARTVAVGSGHGDRQSAAELAAVLPPEGREILAKHKERANRLLADVLRRGINDGSFGNDLDPNADSPLILGLLAAAEPDNPGRAIELVKRIATKTT